MTGMVRRDDRFVYFIQAGDDGPIKIGSAVDPIARLKELQVGNPQPLHILMTLADDEGLERQLHQRFAPLRLHGEWFRPEQELAALAWMPGLLPPPDPPQPSVWGVQHLTAEDIDRVRALEEPAAAAELADDLIRVRFMQQRKWDAPLATPAA